MKKDEKKVDINMEEELEFEENDIKDEADTVEEAASAEISEDELEIIKKSLELERDKYLRLQAEFLNYKKRVEKEKLDIYKNASVKLISDLLPILDDFDRALSHADETNSFMDGIKLIVKRLEECLQKEGLEVIETLNTDFDPNYHHAVMMEETDEVESGKIFEEVQKGYKVNGKVIRPAMVKVAK